MKAGFVSYNGKRKPFTFSREIRRGKNKGRIEVEIRLGTIKGIVPRKRIVNQDDIRRYPE
ncbi:MAG: hypothetical protein JW882_13485 [Deltaproteobacteria bacterium]|nr:hypothetical protein [Deltaproteobacteria bacterium]